MSLKKNLLYNFILSASQVAFPLISIPYVSRVLDPAGIGKVSFIDSLTYYFVVIAEFGIVTYGIREISRKKTAGKELRSTVSELLSLHLFTSLLSLLLYSVAISFLFTKVSDVRLVLFSISFLLVNGFACEWYFWGTERFSYITFRSLITRVLGLLSMFVLIRKPEDYVWYYTIITFSAFANLAWNGFILFREVDFKIQKPNFKKYWPSLKVTYQISLVYSIVLMLDNVFLRVLSTSAAVAYYAYSAKIVRMAGTLVTDTLLVLYPRTVSLVHSNDTGNFQRLVLNASNIIILVTVPISVATFLIADKVTSVYLGDKFMPVIINLKILSLYPLVKAYSLFINKQLLMPFDKERVVLNGLWIGAVIFLIITIPLALYYRDKGVCVALIASEVSVLVYYLFCVKNFGPNLKLLDADVLYQATFGSVLFFPLVYLLNSLITHPLLNLLSILVCCVVFYFAFLYFIVKNRMLVLLIQSVFSKVTKE